MQEQYINELVFKCLTLECDLGSAVTHLITQPGQFAGTCIYQMYHVSNEMYLTTKEHYVPIF